MKTIALFAAGIDIADIIQFVVVAIIVIGSAIAQMIKAAAKNAPRRNIPPVANPRPQPPRPLDVPQRQAAPQRPVAPQPDAVRDELEKFLRRVANPQPGGSPQKQRQRPASLSRDEVVVASVKPEKRLVQSKPGELPSQVGGRVSQQVDKYLDEGEFEKRAEHLGEKVAQADDRFEKHLKSVFGHKIGSLANQAKDGSMSSDSASSVASITTGDATIPAFNVLFGNQAALRNAIVVNEILRRPEERWD
jgi:hypothetical protein